MPEQLTLLGATGSIGNSTLAVLEAYPERFSLHAIAGGSRVEPLIALAKKHRPKRVGIGDERQLEPLVEGLRQAGLKDIDVGAGPSFMVELALDRQADTVVQAMVGAAGVAPTFAAAQAGKRLLLANKESVVCGGSLLMNTVRRAGCQLLPVDSEHNAIFQCLDGLRPSNREDVRLILTASGGPFRTRMDLSQVTVEQALKHPNWAMGAKITIDSATLMNKGLEVIEARWLFNVPADRIEVVVHPQSVIHSAIRLRDGSILAQMGVTDMICPIAYALGYPDRLASGLKPFDFFKHPELTFERPDLERFPLLGLAFDALKTERLAPSIVLNAANEVANQAFRDGQVSFLAISGTVKKALDAWADMNEPKNVEDILALDQFVRQNTPRLL